MNTTLISTSAWINSVQELILRNGPRKENNILLYPGRELLIINPHTYIALWVADLSNLINLLDLSSQWIETVGIH